MRPHIRSPGRHPRALGSRTHAISRRQHALGSHKHALGSRKVALCAPPQQPGVVPQRPDAPPHRQCVRPQQQCEAPHRQCAPPQQQDEAPHRLFEGKQRPSDPTRAKTAPLRNPDRVGNGTRHHPRPEDRMPRQPSGWKPAPQNRATPPPACNKVRCAHLANSLAHRAVKCHASSHLQRIGFK